VNIYPASAERPPDYPAGLPFIPGALVEITEFADAAVMKWFAVERPFEVMQQLVGMSAADGWQAEPATTAPGKPAALAPDGLSAPAHAEPPAMAPDEASATLPAEPPATVPGHPSAMFHDDAATSAGPARPVHLTAGDLERDIEVLQAGPFTSVVLRQRHRRNAAQ
jgi:hypothetical protein